MEKRLRKTMEQARASLFSDFMTRKNGAELVETLRNLLAMTYAFAHYAGIRRGYVIGCQLCSLDSWKTEDDAKNAIAGIIEMYPEWTTRQIFKMLDTAKKPLFHLGSLPKNTKRWSDVVSEPAYKMFVTRIRQKVRAVSRIKGWQKLMDTHEDLRRTASSIQN